MTNKKRLLIILAAAVVVLTIIHYSTTVLGAPSVFISTPATSTPTQNFFFSIGTSTAANQFGSTTLAVYGSTTIQTWKNTTHALEVFNAASTSIFRVDTVSGLVAVAGGGTSTFAGGISLSAGCFLVGGSCVSGGDTSLLVFNPFSAASYVGTSTATSTLSGGIYATRIAAPYFNATSSTATSTLQRLSVTTITGTDLSLTGALSVTGATLLPGGVTITCTSCITDTNVSDTLTASDLIAGSSVVSDAEVDGDLTISGGTVNNSPIGATTPSTGAFTTLSSNGLFSLFGNLTGTSTVTIDTGGTVNLSNAVVRTTSSSSLTTVASGAFGVDTTDGQFRYNSSGASTSSVLVATSSFSANIASSSLSRYGGLSNTATSTIAKAGYFQAVTITELYCQSSHYSSIAQNAIIQVGNGTATSTIEFCNNTGQLSQLNPDIAIGANSNIYIVIGSASGTVPDFIYPNIRYEYNPL